MFGLWSRLTEPAIFQGSLRKEKYFEGWYFKHISGDRTSKLAVIPGVSLTEKESHAFIQVLNGSSGKTYYFTYPIQSFKPRKRPFGISIDKNEFSLSEIKLDLNNGRDRIIGSLQYSNLTPYYQNPGERGVMGWYGYIPLLETYHGLLSMDHRVEGEIIENENEHLFNNGRGYIEKDWGESFPSSWIWMQSNGFSTERVSVMISVAVIPWLKSSFIGHLALLHFNEKTFNFSTYRGGKIKSFVKKDTNIELIIETKKYSLSINAIKGEGFDLKSPIKGLMTGRTVESLNSEINVSLFDKKNKESIFSGVGFDAGLEIMDNRDELINGLNLRSN